MIFAKFAEFFFLQTCVLKKGWNNEPSKRSQAWDKSMTSFMRRKREASFKIMWIGDLNAATQDEDLSPAAYFRQQTSVHDKHYPRNRAAVPEEEIWTENVEQPECTD